MNQLSSRIDALLQGLGDSAERVALSLSSKGVHGVRNTVRMLNPVVRYLQDALHESGLSLDLVTPGTVRFKRPDGSMQTTTVPQPVADFLIAFNQGNHPELEMAPDALP